MATNLLDADFGSESEDDNFNPAPAVGSDDERLEDSDAQKVAKLKMNGTTSSRSLDDNNGHRSSGASGQIRVGDNGDLDVDEEDDEDGEADDVSGNLDGRLEEDEEDEDDEDDEEDAVTVSME